METKMKSEETMKHAHKKNPPIQFLYLTDTVSVLAKPSPIQFLYRQAPSKIQFLYR